MTQSLSAPAIEFQVNRIGHAPAKNTGQVSEGVNHGEVWSEGKAKSRKGNARAQERYIKKRTVQKKVTSRKQAIAIGLSEARRAGGKVPRKSSTRKAKKK